MKYLKIFFFLFFSVLFFVFINKELAFTFYAEQLFLKFHNNSLSIRVLNISNLEKNAKANFLLGRIYFTKGLNKDNLFLSIKYFSKAIDIAEKGGKNPTDFSLLSQSYYGRGLSYGFLDDIYLLNAEKDFRKYIEIEDEVEKETGKRSYGSWAGYNDLAWILYLQGDFKNGEIAAKDGLKMSYDNPWLLNMLGILQIEQDNCKEAKDNLEKAFKILNIIDENKWGEAYSGDRRDRYKKGKEDMLESIKYNIKICTK